MSTRHQKTAGPVSQERYMSSNEFAELRGVSGIAVSARSAVLVSARKRSFLWWLQGQSLAEGGFKRLAKELLAAFPDRIGTPAMHQDQIKPGKTYPGEFVEKVNYALGLRDTFSTRETQPATGENLLQLCREFALRHRDHSEERISYSGKTEVPSLEEFMVDLCINPRLHFSEPDEKTDFSSIEAASAIEENPELSRDDFKKASVPYFRDVVGALFEYQARQVAQTVEGFYLTAIGKQVWATLDFAIARRRMVVLDGLEGRGKTEAVKAWCAQHQGVARFVSLKGITSKTTAFREIARALGIASSYTRTAPEMQARIEDVLKRSKLMLVVDEAHFVFNQSRRMYTRPELVDWIDTAVCNRGVPIALVTTPQFLVCMTRAADQVEWNYRQFRRRVARWEKLPATNTEEDIKAVAQSVFKNADAQTISMIAGYALLSKRDLSAIGDVADEVRAMLGTDDLAKTTARHVHRAIHEFLLPSDKNFLEGMAAARNNGKKSGRKPAPAAPVDRSEILGADVSEDGRLPAPFRSESATPGARDIRPASSLPASGRRSITPETVEA